MKIVIYGAGVTGYHTLNHLHDQGLDAECFCDGNPDKWGTEWYGKSVFSPDKMLDKDCHLIIATFDFETVLADLNKKYSREKLPSKISICSPRYGLEARDLPNRPDLSSLYDQDDRTNRQYTKLYSRGFMNGAQLWDYEDVANLPPMTYFEGLFNVEKLPEITLLDAGAYDGDSIKQITDYFQGRTGQIYAFEPSEQMLPLLKSNLREWGLADITTCLPFGLGSSSATLTFSGNDVEFGWMGDFNANRMFGPDFKSDVAEVRIETLDSLDLDIKYYPFIKMDIEGMEPEALKGMPNFIKRYKPVFALCVYHNSAHESILPSYIKSLVPGYKFYFSGGFHVVCYGVPDELQACVRMR